MSFVVMPTEGFLRIIQAVWSGGNLGSQTPSLGLWKETKKAMVRSIVWDDLTECDFPGYERVSSPIIGVTADTEQVTVFMAGAVFTRAENGSSETALGWFLIDQDDKLLAVSEFAVPVVFENPGDVFGLVPRLTFTSRHPAPE